MTIRIGALAGAHLARRAQPTVKVELPGGGPVLVPIAWEQLGAKRPRPPIRPRSQPDRSSLSK